MTTLHLIHGFIGVGKTTFAKKLESEQHMIRFTYDEWMVTLFGSNPPKNYFKIYEHKIKHLIWIHAKKFLEIGKDVVLDFGFWKKEERDHYRKLARDMNIYVKVYNLQCPEEVITTRVLKRTSEKNPGDLFINEHALIELKKDFEPIDNMKEDSIIILTI